MTMDFSRLHTYTPPQCAPENTGYTYSLSSSYSTAALEFEQEHKLGPVYDSPRMSRRSLRLHTMGGLYGNSSLTENSQNHSVSYSSSSAGSSRRSVRSRRLQASSSSQARHGPQTAQCSEDVSSPGTALRSRRLEQSTVTHSPAEHSYVGAVQNAEMKRWRETSALNSPPLNGSTSLTETHSMVENGYICQNCSIHTESEEGLTGCSSLPTLSVSQSGDFVDASSSISTVYSLDKHRKHTGFLASASSTCVRYSRQLFTSIVSVMTLLFRNVFHLGHQAESHERKGVLLSVSDSVRGVCSWLVARGTMLKQSAFQRIRYRADDYHSSAHSSYCGSVNMNDLVTRNDHLDLNSSLCDDCKGKQYLETHTSHTHSSSSRCLLTALWGLVAYTGYGLQHVGRGVGSAGTFVLRKLLSVLWLAILSPGQALNGTFWWLGTAWYQLVTLMSLVNVFILTRCFPKLLKLLLFLLPFLLLLGLWFLGLSRVIYYLPVINVTEWRAKILPALPPVPTFFSLPSLLPISSSSESAAQMERSPLPVTSQPVAASVDSERVARLEQSVAALWESVQQREQQAAQQHGEAVELVRALQEQLNTHADKETLGLWISQLLEPKFDMIRGELEREASDRAQTQELNADQQKVHASRLTQLELLLQTLSSKTEEVYQRQNDSPAPAHTDVSVTQEERDALLAEVQRLEEELGHIRKELQGVMGCQGKCGQFDTLQETVSSQVRQELHTLFYGSETTRNSDAKLPENLLQWLSSQYTSTADLHATLASLERRILGNVSVQLQQSKHETCAETVTQTVAHAVGTAGMTEEQVQQVVQNALRLYSQDRTGLVDYALESGGGSILSTRCSETYETKTALMSLFGVPLWYVSQSPRVVIQPDMYPGNCWAFKGSQGYLVIRLSLSVLPTSFCLEHISKALSPTGNISSAPQHFRVYGMDDEYQEEGKLLGDYTYQEDGESLQTFPVVENNDRPFQIIELRVLSNWGHPEYTCLYRFRVHGQPSTK